MIEGKVSLFIIKNKDVFIAATYDLVHGPRIWELSQAADLYRMLNQSEVIIGWDGVRDVRRLGFVAPSTPLENKTVGLIALLHRAGVTGVSLQQMVKYNLAAILTAADGYTDSYKDAVWRAEASYELYHVWRASGLAARDELIPWPLAGKGR